MNHVPIVINPLSQSAMPCLILLRPQVQNAVTSLENLEESPQSCGISMALRKRSKWAIEKVRSRVIVIELVVCGVPKAW